MKNEVIEYVMNSPGNTNRAVLESMLEAIGSCVSIPIETKVIDRKALLYCGPMDIYETIVFQEDGVNYEMLRVDDYINIESAALIYSGYDENDKLIARKTNEMIKEEGMCMLASSDSPSAAAMLIEDDAAELYGFPSGGNIFGVQ